MKKNGKKKFLENKTGKQQYKNYENMDKKKQDSKAEQRKKDLEQENKFKDKLFKRQYILHLVKRDGNCLFSSISDQVYGTDTHSSIIREKCMDYIEKNKLFYSQFIEGGETQMPAYIQRKRKNGIWGDNLEIQALSEIYSRPIEIYVDVDKPIRSFCNDNNGDKKRFPIKISYHGNKHYNSIVPSVRHSDFPLYKRELLNSNSPGIYETKFIKNYDISKKFNQKYENFNEPIQFNNQNNICNEDDFLYQDAIENSKIDFNEKNKEENKKENNCEGMKSNEEYLSNPIIQNALEFGFNLNDAIEALEVCGNNEELVMDYLCNNQNK